jgi:hypothetical protein
MFGVLGNGLLSKRARITYGVVSMLTIKDCMYLSRPGRQGVHYLPEPSRDRSALFRTLKEFRRLITRPDCHQCHHLRPLTTLTGK